jgi:hypothetical protein
MGSNEIRLRKQKLNPGRIASHRDYAELMRRHKRGLKTKQLLLLVVYIIIVLLLILLSFIAVRVEKNKEVKSSPVLIEEKHIFISSQMPLPWSDEQFSSTSDYPKA